MFGAKDWEVYLYGDYPEHQEFYKNFRSRRKARRYIRKTLRKNERYYCALIWHEASSSFDTYYWNGNKVIKWDKPWVLSSRQALNLETDKHGRLITIS